MRRAWPLKWCCLSKVLPQILKIPSIDSTNKWLKERALSGAPEGTVVLAEMQTLGRGRSERLWHSPLGGLYFSVLIKPKSLDRPTDFSLMAGIAMSQTVKFFLPREGGVGVKWPNDCLLHGKKVGGVLCEVVGDPTDYSVIVGIGLNVNTSLEELKEFEHRPFKAASMKAASNNASFVIDEVCEKYLDYFFTLYECYLERGFSVIQSLWEKECLFLGKKIELTETGLSQRSENLAKTVQGIFLGIDERGALVVSQGPGDRRSYVTGEVSCYWP